VSDLRVQLEAGLTGQYALLRELGRGGMATVFLATDLKHDRPVAFKVLHPDLAQSLGPERFQREIRLATLRANLNLACGRVPSREDFRSSSAGRFQPRTSSSAAGRCRSGGRSGAGSGKSRGGVDRVLGNVLRPKTRSEIGRGALTADQHSPLAGEIPDRITVRTEP